MQIQDSSGAQVWILFVFVSLHRNRINKQRMTQKDLTMNDPRLEINKKKQGSN